MFEVPFYDGGGDNNNIIFALQQREKFDRCIETLKIRPAGVSGVLPVKREQTSKGEFQTTQICHGKVYYPTYSIRKK